MLIRRLKFWFNQRTTSIVVFTYGIVVGTSAPLLLSRCATSGSSCGNCGGFCSLALSILPLVLFITMKSRAQRAGQHVFSLVRRTVSRSD